MITWAQWDDDGYEVSSRGDRRYSPLFARMPDGRTIEAHYQCDVKGFDPGGVAWMQFKGRNPAGVSRQQLWEGFLGLWRVWAAENKHLMRHLLVLAEEHNGVLTDRFAKTSINQAHALSVLLNEMRPDSLVL